ncbi:MAG: hypothetical protein GXP49_10770 [Deltaproteobacteria bacterium]|nr:hypothetical protein [Deltaproteobacteria bacterium]
MKQSRFFAHFPLASIFFLLPVIAGGCQADDPLKFYPSSGMLPFHIDREKQGDPLDPGEVRSLTQKVTDFLRQIDYFTWVYETCHGLDASTGYPDYLIWWHDVDAVKSGDLVTFRNNSKYGGSHNNAEPTGSVLTQALAGYLLTGDHSMGMVAEEFAKSITALMKGFVHDKSDPLEYLMTRNIVTHNHSFTLPSGKKKAVDYSDWFFEYEGWNANRYHYPDNPYFGDIWVTTMRSKDDLPYLYRAAAWFPYARKTAPDESVRKAVSEAWRYMQGFAKDIVDNNYHIRTKDKQGKPYIPDEDLASFVDYLKLFPDAECDARLATALLAYNDDSGIDCGDGQGSGYDRASGAMHYYNYSIVDNFHLAAVHLALVLGKYNLAKRLVRGLVRRLERYEDPGSNEPGRENPDWQRDVALLLLKSAALGMPLTNSEARMVEKFYSQSVDAYLDFPNWDLWDESVPDGTYDFRSGFRPAHVPDAFRIEDIAYILEYCWSPFKDTKGAVFVDCNQVETAW